MNITGQEGNHSLMNDFQDGTLASSVADPLTTPLHSTLLSPTPEIDDLKLSPAQREVIGNDIILRGSAGQDFLEAGAGNDTLYGLAGEDVLEGLDGSDHLLGGTGLDQLVGGEGDDTLIDTDGGDKMTGGEGADQFWLASWDEPDVPTVITDFEVGKDQIKIGRLEVSFDQLTFEALDGDTIVGNGEEVLAILSDVDAVQLTPESFVLGEPGLAAQLLWMAVYRSQGHLALPVRSSLPMASPGKALLESPIWQRRPPCSRMT
jgi:Ca2+-binding RTX toxin-like protein